MDSGRHEDHLPKADHLGMLRERLSGCQHVQGTAVGSSQKTGAASADIYLDGTTVLVETDSRRLSIHTADPSAVIARVKHIWRKDLRGPNLRDRSAQTA